MSKRYTYKNQHKSQLFFVVMALLALLTGCDNSDSTSPQSTTIIGTAATGLAVDGLVTATSSSGNVSEQVGINADGQFSVEIEGEPPYLLMAQSTDGSITLFSIGFEAGTTNITPFSHQVLKDLFSGQQLVSVFNNWSVENTSVDEQSVSKSVVSLVNATASEFINANIEKTTFDALRSQFITDHTGFDAVLDAIASSLPAGTPAADGSISYPSDSGGLIFIDPDDPTEIPDDADTPPISIPDEQIFIDPNDDTEIPDDADTPPISLPDEQIFIDPNDDTKIPDDADTPALPALNSPDELIFVDPNDDTKIPLDADTPSLDLN